MKEIILLKMFLSGAIFPVKTESAPQLSIEAYNWMEQEKKLEVQYSAGGSAGCMVGLFDMSGNELTRVQNLELQEGKARFEMVLDVNVPDEVQLVVSGKDIFEVRKFSLSL